MARSRVHTLNLGSLQKWISLSRNKSVSQIEIFCDNPTTLFPPQLPSTVSLSVLLLELFFSSDIPILPINYCIWSGSTFFVPLEASSFSFGPRSTRSISVTGLDSLEHSNQTLTSYHSIPSRSNIRSNYTCSFQHPLPPATLPIIREADF